MIGAKMDLISIQYVVEITFFFPNGIMFILNSNKLLGDLFHGVDKFWKFFLSFSPKTSRLPQVDI